MPQLNTLTLTSGALTQVLKPTNNADGVTTYSTAVPAVSASLQPTLELSVISRKGSPTRRAKIQYTYPIEKLLPPVPPQTVPTKTGIADHFIKVNIEVISSTQDLPADRNAALGWAQKALLNADILLVMDNDERMY